MGQLSDSQLSTVRALLSTAPDCAVRDLEATLSSGSQGHDVMRMIQAMVASEALDRRARNAIFRPLIPLCTNARASLGGMIFPAAALANVWAGLKQSGGRQVEFALSLAAHGSVDEAPEGIYDQLCAEAAAGLRARANPSYTAAADLLEQASSGGAEQFAAYLDLAPVARRALDRMHEWLGRLTEERSAVARLTFRDAVAVADDAGPRLLEILYAHLEEPWAILRLVSAVMHRPGDSYVANSELAQFGDRLLEDIDAQLKRVAAFDADRGAEGGLAVAAALRTAALEIQEFDESVDLSREGPWGTRLMRQKKALVLAIEGRLRAVEAEVAGALPLQNSGPRRKTRGHPRLSADPDPRQIQRVRAFLSLLREVRTSAERLGYGALWAKTSEAVQGRLDTYVEDLLETLRAAEGDNLDRVRAYLDVAAEFQGMITDERAAQIVRRRIAAAA